MAELFTNLARSTLASGISAVAVSLTVQSGDGNDLFPALGGGDFFTCLLFKKSTGDVEFIKVTARTGDAFTITRAQEQIGNITATAFAFDAGDIIELRPTKGFFDSLTLTASSIQSGEFLYGGTDTGSANVYVFALNPVVSALTVGMQVRCKVAFTNTGASTLNIGPGAVTILMEDGGGTTAGVIRASFTHTFTYNGTNWILQSAGLYLLSAGGYDVGNRQMKNVAAGTAATDVATIGGTETHSNKTYISPVINTGVSGTAGVSRMIRDTVQATTSGTSKDFTIPSWAKKIIVPFDQVSTSSASFVLFIRIGTSSTPDTTGYESTASIISVSAATLTASTIGFYLCDLVPAAEYVSGVATIVNTTGNVWEISGTAHNAAAGVANRTFSFAGRKSLSGALDIVRFASGGTFDNGQINAIYEG